MRGVRGGEGVEMCYSSIITCDFHTLVLVRMVCFISGMSDRLITLSLLPLSLKAP